MYLMKTAFSSFSPLSFSPPFFPLSLHNDVDGDNYSITAAFKAVLIALEPAPSRSLFHRVARDAPQLKAVRISLPKRTVFSRD